MKKKYKQLLDQLKTTEQRGVGIFWIPGHYHVMIVNEAGELIYKEIPPELLEKFQFWSQEEWEKPIAELTTIKEAVKISRITLELGS